MGNRPTAEKKFDVSTKKSKEITSENPQTAIDDLVKNYLAVVGMDFGTVNSGFAFSFKDDYKNFHTASVHSKFSTSVLLNSEKKLHSFGDRAVEDYLQILEEVDAEAEESNDMPESTSAYKATSETSAQQSLNLMSGSNDADTRKSLHDWYYFKQFKMALYMTERLTRETKIKDSQGREMEAMTIISLAIEHLKNLAFNIITESKVGKMSEADILYVLTIPAIWSDSARQFMREAAIKAGISKEHLRLVLEPEAASMFCRDQASVVIQSDDGHRNIGNFPKGFRYILADIGGGTVDICVHEMVDNGRVKELYRDTGGPYGGIHVDKEFEKLIAEVIGETCLEEFQRRHPWQFTQFISDFQKKKTTFGKETLEDRSFFHLSPQFTELVHKQHGKGFQEILAATKYSETIRFKKTSNVLALSNKILEEVFKPSASKIAEMIETVKTETGDKDLKTIILVGGYSDSKYLRDTIQERVPDMKILHELDAKLAVMKGAVLMGWNPKTVVSRKARFTYGYRVLHPFDETVHPHSTRCQRGGTYYCSRIFERQIEKGQEIRDGQIAGSIRTRNKIQGNEDRQREFTTEVFRSSRPDPKFCTEEEDCKIVGKIAMTPPAGGWPDSVTFKTQLIVGETEFTVKVVEEGSGKEHVSIIDFL